MFRSKFTLIRDLANQDILLCTHGEISSIQMKCDAGDRTLQAKRKIAPCRIELEESSGSKESCKFEGNTYSIDHLEVTVCMTDPQFQRRWMPQERSYVRGRGDFDEVLTTQAVI